MSESWKKFLGSRGIVVAQDRVRPMIDPRGDVRAAAGATVVTPLPQFALIRACGIDIQSFLQSQLTNDVAQVDGDNSQLSALCNAKGRMLALFRIFKRTNELYLQLPIGVANDVLSHLRKYVLRSKVTLELADSVVAMGVSGPDAEARVIAAIGIAPEQPDAVGTRAHITVIRLPGPTPRFMLIAPLEAAESLWIRLQVQATIVGSDAWDWLDIQAGLPTILPPTQGELVPQMANLDLVRGISFTKGCYPGQEIVARLHYLGRLKQRMYIAHVMASEAPKAGDRVYAASQASGVVVSAAPAPNEGFDLLASIHIAGADQGKLFLGGPEGHPLTLGTLPYSLSVSSAG